MGALHGVYLVANHLWRAAKTRLGLFRGESTRLRLLVAAGVTFLAVVVAWVPFRAASLAQAGDVLAGMIGLNGVALPEGLESGSLGMAWAWILGLLAVAWLAPNTQEIMARHLPQMRGLAGADGLMSWRPATSYAVAAAVVGVLALSHLRNVSEFLYFQF